MMCNVSSTSSYSFIYDRQFDGMGQYRGEECGTESMGHTASRSQQQAVGGYLLLLALLFACCL